MKPRVTQITVGPEDCYLYSEWGHTVKIEDEGGGEFIVVKDHCEEYGKIGIDIKDWPALRAAINRMAKECRTESLDEEE